MNALVQTAIFILLVVGMMGFFYKIYLQIVIKDPTKKGKYYYVVLRLIYVTDFFPLRIKYKKGEELQLRKTANRALAVFYGSLILTGILITFFL